MGLFKYGENRTFYLTCNCGIITRAMSYLAIITILLIASSAYAEKYTIQSEINDLEPGDGFMEAGTPSNPYVVKDSGGSQVETISTQMQDLVPGDGLFEAGSSMNPYVVETDD